MNKFSTKMLCRAGIIAALYIVLTLINPISFGPVQMRVSEMLVILPLFYVESIPALFIGCALSDIIGGFGYIDMLIGGGATLLAAIATYIIGKAIKNVWARFFVGALPPVLFNAFLIPIIFLLIPEATDQTYMFNVMTVGVGELLSVYVFGAVVYFAIVRLQKTKAGDLFS